MYEFSWFDLIPYILLVVILTLILFGAGSAKSKARNCFWVLFLFAAVRYGIGYDYYAYKKSVLHQVADYTMERYEPLSRLLIDIGYHTHYQLFFILCSILTLFPLYKACLKLSINPAFSLIIYFLFPLYYLESLSIVRNAIAYSLVLYVFVLLNQKKLTSSIILLIIAILFHKSAIIGVCIYPLFYINITKRINILLFIASFVLSNIVIGFIGDYASIIPFLTDVERYAEHARSEGGTMTYIINGLNIYNFIVWDRMCKMSKLNSKYLLFTNFGCCIWNIFLPIDSTLALRLSSFFVIYIIFLVPQYKYLYSFNSRKFVGHCSYCFFLLLFISYFLININAYLKKPDKMSNLPYQTIFYHKDYSNYVF